MIGGWAQQNFPPGSSIQLALTQLYDPASNSLADGPPMVAPLADVMAVTLNDGRVLVAGPHSQQTQLYDPITNTFTAGASMNQQGACSATLIK